jgi:hypothetical protein
VCNALGEDGLDSPGAVGLTLGEVDHRLFGTAQVKRRPALLHRLADGGHIGVRVGVEQLQEEAKVFRVALVRHRGEQQQVIRAVAQQLPEAVAQALVRLVGGGHAMRLVHDHQIPVHLAQARQDLGTLGEIQRGYDAVSLQPLVDAELLADVMPLHDEKRRVELLLKLALPLKRQVRRAHDEDPFGQPAQLQLADQQPRHDRFAGAGIVGQQEANPRQLEQVIVDGLQLVRQRIDAGNGQSEVGVKLPGYTQGVRLQTETNRAAVAVEGCRPESTVSRWKSAVASVTRRKRSDCRPDSPTTHTSGPAATTVSTRIGSLNSGPERTWPGCTGGWAVIGPLLLKQSLLAGFSWV